MSITNSATNLGTTLGDFLTGARYDLSGLTSAINEYLDGVRREYGPNGFAERAEAAGYGDIVARWKADDKTGPMTEDMVRTLIVPNDLEWFAGQTGLSDRAVVMILAKQLPIVVYKRAHAVVPH
ncbi:conserved hypothetical protein [Gluconacetobacter diazotrophicus PA1 5]|uniref:Uncharacterized protein n=2 Tax=Gluconacetobacter diazotrophicus TaxID=33996 RepID=A9HM78_GLUDA|nr:YidB family protein [Gluconacetobacter diazotrophicus]ACI50366.1 conserved hypothetical protein [Gluconacetobacter diazotrophicus PA1 5]MBB2154715.1 hypothetical protein [Gluconacetobacter diazotrophicus]TWB08339.1 hypothetical protein FBZ86_10775 [Gluconacetobacter diazotrophicus]CAP56271.1 hypothetical protein GDI2328 [Gluconacetobacter diazotrophicus PA1 5]